MPYSDHVTYIINCCREHALLLPEAVRSVLSQDHSNISIIVFLDWHDSLKDVADLKNSTSTNNNIFVTTDKTVGKSIGFNIAFRYARSRYLCLLDADDLVLSNKTTAQLQFLKEKNQFSYCGTSYYIQHQHDRITSPVNMFQITIADIFWQPLFLYSSLMIDLKRVNFTGLDESLQVAMDYKLSHELVKSSLGANLPERLVIYRFGHSTNASVPQKRASQLINHSIILCDQVFARLSPTDKANFVLLFSMGLSNSCSESDSVINAIINDPSINEARGRAVSIPEHLDRLRDAIMPRFSEGFTVQYPNIERNIYAGASLLSRLSSDS